jgi:hypothetical protein
MENGERALGIRLEKQSPKDWPTVVWAVVASSPRSVVDQGTTVPPRSYSEAEALRHIHEAVASAVRENAVTKTLVWTIETNARMNNAMRPRLRAEGAACAAAASAGSSAELVAWSEIESRAGAERTKAEYEKANQVCGVEIGDADSRAVLVAIAALGR